MHVKTRVRVPSMYLYITYSSMAPKLCCTLHEYRNAASLYSCNVTFARKKSQNCVVHCTSTEMHSTVQKKCVFYTSYSTVQKKCVVAACTVFWQRLLCNACSNIKYTGSDCYVTQYDTVQLYCSASLVNFLHLCTIFKILQRNTCISVRFFFYEYRDVASVYTVLEI